jgi:hypothetical protein
MSALTPLPPDVEKMWITVDKKGITGISTGFLGVLKSYLRKGREGRWDLSTGYPHHLQLYPQGLRITSPF